MTAPAPSRHYYSLWFLANADQDFMLFLFRDAAGLFAEYRFRFCDPTDPRADPFEGKDHKSGAQIEFGPTNEPEDVRTKLRAFVGHVAATLKPDIHEEVVVNGSEEDFVRALSTRPWAHIRTFDSKEEADRFMKERRKRSRQ